MPQAAGQAPGVRDYRNARTGGRLRRLVDQAPVRAQGLRSALVYGRILDEALMAEALAISGGAEALLGHRACPERLGNLLIERAIGAIEAPCSETAVQEAGAVLEAAERRTWLGPQWASSLRVCATEEPDAQGALGREGSHHPAPRVAEARKVAARIAGLVSWATPDDQMRALAMEPGLAYARAMIERGPLSGGVWCRLGERLGWDAVTRRGEMRRDPVARRAAIGALMSSPLAPENGDALLRLLPQTSPLEARNVVRHLALHAPDLVGLVFRRLARTRLPALTRNDWAALLSLPDAAVRLQVQMALCRA